MIRTPSSGSTLSPAVVPTGNLSFVAETNPGPSEAEKIVRPKVLQNAERSVSYHEEVRKRRRRASSLMYHEPSETLDHLSDQAVNPNLNAQWVNAKGAWVIHPILILLLKIVYDIVPSITQETSWTLTNITYMFGSYLMFHWVRGVPFEFNSGAYDNLNMWEQLDGGKQYTPAKKFLLAVPICLFLISTHYTHYDLTYFMINLLATVAVVVPKLPVLHRMRFAIFSPPPQIDVHQADTL